MNPILYRYKDTESVIKRMDGYTPGEGWEPLYSQDQISSAVNAALKATAPDELERLRQIAHLTGTIFCYGNFVAETHNEAVLEKLLRENGTFWDSVEQYEKSQGWRP